MARKNEQAAITTIGSADSLSDEAAALALLNEFDFGTDGLQEADASDFRLPVIVWNLKGKDQATGQPRRLEEFYDTLNERSFPELTCAFLHLHKTRAFARFSNDTNETTIHCSSDDRIVGRLRTKHPDLNIAEGTERKCETCQDKEWYRNDKGKNLKNCDEIYGVFGVHLDPETLLPGDGFLARFKRTSLQPFKTHLQRHHLGRRPLPNGQRANMPLFMYAVSVRLEISDNGNFATPVFTRRAPLPRETVMHLSEQAKFFTEIGSEATRAAEKAERAEVADMGGAAAGGGSTSAADFVD
jgi:hypothetical protein